MKVPTLRREIDRIADAQQLPVLLIMVAFWIVCAVEWAQRFLGIIPDPRFWSFISFVVTVYGGVQIFRLNRPNRIIRKRDPRMKGFRALRRVFADGSGKLHNVATLAAGLDNVLVSEAGVYAVQVRHRSGSGVIERGADGELVFGGRLRDSRLLERAVHATQPVQELLASHFLNPPIVRPLIVLVGNWKLDAGFTPTDVDVVSVGDLAEYFRQQAAALDADEVGQISDCLSSLAA